MGQIQGTSVSLQIRQNGTTGDYLNVVCETTSSLSGSASVTTAVTKCNTITSVSAPTITFANVMSQQGGTGKAVTAISDAGSTQTTGFLRCDHSSGFTVGGGATLINDNNANGFLRFSSEL
jgi:hypothetical protein